MTVDQKQIEILANQYVRENTSNWDYAIVASAAFLAGFKAARKLLAEEQLGEKTLKADYPDGEHQLSPASFRKWMNGNYE